MLRSITFKGAPLTLVGRGVKVNQRASYFRAVSRDMNEATIANFKDKIKVITSFPSLDTPVCDLQVKEFNKRATQMSGDVMVIGISKDLPFAQERFCQTHGIENVVVLSDYKFSSFGINYGLLIKELNLLARSVMIVDRSDFIRYIQLVKELTHQPDYDDVLRNLDEVVRNPRLSLEQVPSHCKPCEGGVPSLPKEKIGKLLAQHRGWGLIDDKKIRKEFTYKDFVEAKYFIDLISIIAQEQDHHPTITIRYNKVTITLTTHAAGGLTENDFIMARIIDEVGGIK